MTETEKQQNEIWNGVCRERDAALREVEALRQERDEAQNGYNDHAAECRRLTAELERVTSERDALQKELADWRDINRVWAGEAELTTLREQLAAADQALAKMLGDIGTLQEQLASARSDVKTNGDLMVTHYQEMERLREQLGAAQTSSKHYANTMCDMSQRLATLETAARHAHDLLRTTSAREIAARIALERALEAVK